MNTPKTLAHCAFLLTAPALAGSHHIINELGDRVIVNDFDGDGFDDLWVHLNFGASRRSFHRSKEVDTDGDGISDYREMLLWRDPHVKGPAPRRLTAEEIAHGKRRAERAKEARRQRLRRVRESILPHVTTIHRPKTREERREKLRQVAALSASTPTAFLENQGSNEISKHGGGSAWIMGAVMSPDYKPLTGAGVTVSVLEDGAVLEHPDLPQIEHHGYHTFTPPVLPNYLLEFHKKNTHAGSVMGVILARKSATEGDQFYPFLAGTDLTIILANSSGPRGFWRMREVEP